MARKITRTNSGHETATIQRCQPLLQRLSEFQLVDGINKRGVRRELSRLPHAWRGLILH